MKSVLALALLLQLPVPKWKLKEHTASLLLDNGDEVVALWAPEVNPGEEILSYYDDLHDKLLPGEPVNAFRTTRYIYQGLVSGSLVVQKELTISYRDKSIKGYEARETLYLPSMNHGIFELRNSIFVRIRFSLASDDAGTLKVRAVAE